MQVNAERCSPAAGLLSLDPSGDPTSLLSSLTMGTEVEVQFGRSLQVTFPLLPCVYNVSAKPLLCSLEQSTEAACFLSGMSLCTCIGGWAAEHKWELPAGGHGAQAARQRHRDAVDAQLPAQLQAAHAVQHRLLLALPAHPRLPVLLGDHPAAPPQMSSCCAHEQSRFLHSDCNRLS